MSGTVDVGVVPRVRVVFDMCGGDGDTTLSLFRGLVDFAIFEERSVAFFSLPFCDGSSQGGLAVIDMTDCA